MWGALSASGQHRQHSSGDDGEHALDDQVSLKVFRLDEKALAAGVSCRFVDDGNSITDFNTELQWMETSNVDGVQKPADPTDAHNVYT